MNLAIVSSIATSTSVSQTITVVPAVALPTSGYSTVSSNLPVFKQFIPDQRRWEITHERMRQVDSLYRLGELSVFCLMWNVEDFNAGLVQRCPTCQETSSLITSTYTQPAFDRCPTCYGHLYAGAHGGVKALLIRPGAWTYNEGDNRYLPRGEIEAVNATVTTSFEVRLYTRDYVFRGDGQRFGVTAVQGIHLANGFGTSSHTTEAIAYSYSVAKENPSSPAWMIGFLTPELIALLDVPYRRTVPDFTQWEFMDGPVSV